MKPSRRLRLALEAQRLIREAEAAGRPVSQHLRTLAQPTRLAAARR